MAAVEAPLAPTTNGISRTNGTLNGNGDLHDATSAEPAISFDPSVFRSYLLSLLPPIFGVPSEDLESIFDEDFDDRVSRFAGEGGGVVYVVKKRDEQDGEHPSLSFKPLGGQFVSISSRGRPAHILLQTHAESHLRPYPCHDTCNHQTRSHPRSNILFSLSATHP